MKKKNAIVAFAMGAFLAACDGETTTEKIVEVASDSDFEFSCSTKELKDKSGIKIICNGDSIGVVLNGAKGDPGVAGKDGENGANGKSGKDGKKGDAGDDGAGCTIVAQDESSVTITCGDSTMTLHFGGTPSTDSSDTTEADSEQIAISLDSLTGYSQKGPFLKGSTVYLYELSDGRTLKQTNGNFISHITSDDGRYKFSSRNLASQYALIVVDGKYRNEVTGKPTATNIQLQAYTNMLARRSANVNLLTHLESQRVYYLVTHDKMSVRAAKKKAQHEIFDAFHIDTTGFKTESEDMDVFGATAADAALLAISILLQGDGDETDLSVLLTEIAQDMETDGLWNGENADSIKTAIADWAFTKEMSKIRKNVESWGLNGGSKVGDFERHVENFIANEFFGIDVCSENDFDSLVVKNKRSNFYEKNYWCLNGFFVSLSKNSYFNENIDYGYLIDKRDRHAYRTVEIEGQVWMAENLDYVYKDSSLYSEFYVTGTTHEIYGNVYSWAAAMDSAGLFSEKSTGCGYDKIKQCYQKLINAYPIRGVCPEGWHLPTCYDDDSEYMLFSDAVYKDESSQHYKLQARGFEEWPDATDAYGFTALPFGAYKNEFDRYNQKMAYFWCSDEYDYEMAGYMFLQPDRLDHGGIYKDRGLSVRCLKDD